MRTSDWSSDVCSSDLAGQAFGTAEMNQVAGTVRLATAENLANPLVIPALGSLLQAHPDLTPEVVTGSNRSEESRVGNVCVSPCRSRWSPYHLNKNPTSTLLFYIKSYSNIYKNKQ